MDLVLVIAAAAALQIVLHEALHSLAVILQGGKVKMLKPWPHRFHGDLYFGRMAWVGDFSARQIALIKLAPIAGGILTVIICGTILFAGITHICVTAIGTCALIDTVRGLLMPWWRDGGDLYSGLKRLDMEPAAMPVTAGALVGIWLVALL